MPGELSIWFHPDSIVDNSCFNCGSYDFVEDHGHGDVICIDCGAIQEEKMVSEEAECRVFSDDPDSYAKQRTGPAQFVNIDQALGSGKQKNIREEKEFLDEGFKLINKILDQMHIGEVINSDLKYRSLEIFQHAFYKQLAEKKNGNRKHFSKKKQYACASIILASKKLVNRVSVSELHRQLGLNKAASRIVDKAVAELTNYVNRTKPVLLA